MTLKACETAGFVCNSGMRQTNPSRILHDHVECLCNSGIRVQQRDATTTNPSRILHDHVEGMCNSGIRVQQRDATTTNPSRTLHDHVEVPVQQRDSCATAGCDNDKSFEYCEYSTITLKRMCNSGIATPCATAGCDNDKSFSNTARITLKACATAGFVCNSRMRQRQILLEYCTITLKACANSGIRVQQRDATTTNPSRILHDHVEGMCNSGIRVQQQDATTTNSSRILHDHVEGSATAIFVCNSGMRQRQILLEYCTITLKACATAGFVCNSGMRQRQILLRILHDHVEGLRNSGDSCATA